VPWDGFLVRFWCQDYQGCPRADAFLGDIVGCHGMDKGHDDLGFMGSIAGDFTCDGGGCACVNNEFKTSNRETESILSEAIPEFGA
jgi:hypothetical protein